MVKERNCMNTARGRIFIVTALALILCIQGLPALAQDKPADDMQLVREKVKADKKLFVAEAMQLTELEAKAFWPIYEKYQKELTKIYDHTLVLIGDYASNYQSMSNEVAKRLTTRLLAIGADHQKLKTTYLHMFRGALSEVKVARYYQLENKIAAAINYDLARQIPLVK
jgi:hypothetical protein